MTHTVIGKLNKAARKHDGQNGATFFIDIGEKNYNFKTKQNVFTNYVAPVFAKDAQASFYESALVEGAIVAVTGTGIIIEMPNDPQYQPRLTLIDAKIVYISSGNQGAQLPQRQAAPVVPPSPTGFPADFDDDIDF